MKNLLFNHGEMEELQLLANYTIEPTRIMEDRLSSSVFKSKDLIDIYERIAHNQNWKTTDGPFAMICELPKYKERIYDIYSMLPCLSQHKYIVDILRNK